MAPGDEGHDKEDGHGDPHERRKIPLAVAGGGAVAAVTGRSSSTDPGPNCETPVGDIVGGMSVGGATRDTRRSGHRPTVGGRSAPFQAGAVFSVMLLVSAFLLAVAVDTSGVASAVCWIALAMVLVLGMRARYVAVWKRHDLAVLRNFRTVIDASGEEPLSALLRRHDEIHRSLRWRPMRTVLASELVSRCASVEDWAAANRAATHLPSLDWVIVRPCLAGRTTHRLPFAARLSANRRWLRPVIPSSAKRANLALATARSVSFFKGDFVLSLLLGRQTWQVRKEPCIAWNCACACARVGDADGAVRWVLRAVKHGHPADQLDTDPDLTSVRDDPRLAKLRPRPTARPVTPTVDGLDFGPYLANR